MSPTLADASAAADDDDMQVGAMVDGAYSTGDAGAGGGALDSLIWHPSDTAVKPIVANRRIERLPEPRYDPKALPFTAMALQVRKAGCWGICCSASI